MQKPEVDTSKKKYHDGTITIVLMGSTLRDKEATALRKKYGDPSFNIRSSVCIIQYICDELQNHKTLGGTSARILYRDEGSMLGLCHDDTMQTHASIDELYAKMVEFFPVEMIRV